jgi:hypothetical protein
MDPGNRVIRLPNDHPESFESLPGFMNFEKSCIDVGNDEWQRSVNLNGHLFGFGALAMLWIIATSIGSLPRRTILLMHLLIFPSAPRTNMSLEFLSQSLPCSMRI